MTEVDYREEFGLDDEPVTPESTTSQPIEQPQLFQQSTREYSKDEVNQELSGYDNKDNSNKSIFEDEQTTIDDIRPSDMEENKSGVIKSINASVPDNYPNMTIHIDPEHQMLKRTLLSIKALVDTELNDSEKIKSENRITVKMLLTTQQGVKQEIIVGTIKPRGLKQLLALTTRFNVDGQFSADKSLDRKLLYALTVI